MSNTRHCRSAPSQAHLSVPRWPATLLSRRQRSNHNQCHLVSLSTLHLHHSSLPPHSNPNRLATRCICLLLPELATQSPLSTRQPASPCPARHPPYHLPRCNIPWVDDGRQVTWRAAACLDGICCSAPARLVAVLGASATLTCKSFTNTYSCSSWRA